MEVNFCPECDNLLYIFSSVDENDKSLYYGCKYCKYHSVKEDKEVVEGVDNEDTNCVYSTKKTISGLDLIKDNKYLKYDITIPHIHSNKNFKCPNEGCKDKRQKIKYINYDSDNMKYLYICETCNTQWTNK